jgi:hypothetical protein
MQKAQLIHLPNHITIIIFIPTGKLSPANKLSALHFLQQRFSHRKLPHIMHPQYNRIFAEVFQLPAVRIYGVKISVHRSVR